MPIEDYNKNIVQATPSTHTIFLESPSNQTCFRSLYNARTQHWEKEDLVIAGIYTYIRWNARIIIRIADMRPLLLLLASSAVPWESVALLRETTYGVITFGILRLMT
jgi:hypothetical protein